MIPKVIYTTWISDQPIPLRFLPYIESWKKVMPDYEIKIISMYSVKHGTFVDKAIEMKNYALAGHYARVQEVYENGGIYFDIDVEAVKRFDDLLNEKMFAGWEDDLVFNNAVFGAEKGHPFLKECLDFMDSYDMDSPQVELNTGPWMFTKLLKDQEIKQMKPKVFYPYHYTEQFTPECVAPETLAIHHWAATWQK